MEIKVSEIRNNAITIALRGIAVLPRMSVYLDMNRPMSISAATNAQKQGQELFLVAQRDQSVENPGQEQLEEYGVLAHIRQIIRGSDEIVRVLVVGKRVARLKAIDQYVPYLVSTVEVFSSEQNFAADESDKGGELREEAMLDILKELTAKYCKVRQNASRELKELLSREWNLDEFSALLACNIPMEQQERINYLTVYCDLEMRFKFLSEWLEHAAEVEAFKREYKSKIKSTLDQQQKDYILREQMKVIRNELGEGQTDTADQYEKRLSELDAPNEVKEQLAKEIKKLRGMNFAGPEIAVSQNYIETLLDMPWEKRTSCEIDIRHAHDILEEDHYGLEKVKEEVLEYLAVKRLNENKNKAGGQILCLVGPPGTGKTSIAKSIARALGRKYMRISLGGVRDEAEIRGHRRTYVAAMPGRIAAGIKKAGVKNPLILFDEIDKIGSDGLHGDVFSAMLEVLDSEQNVSFNDRYLEVGLDLSEVLFITTANTLQTIPQPLLDRMEVIEISSYTETEKYEIARRFLLPKQKEAAGLDAVSLEIDEAALKLIISGYTKEAGVRGLERQLALICRKAALDFLENETASVQITAKNLENYLGKRKYRRFEHEDKGEIGIVQGLAWTSVGGVTLEIEVNVIPGKGALSLTGQLGDVMKESAQTAISYVRSVSEANNIAADFFEKHDIHIHIPEGAVPKDGPSAGITMATAVYSAVTGRRVRSDAAMTGEITLRGRVLAIGGLKEKLLAAAAAGIKRVCVPEQNIPDVEELADNITQGLEIIYVSHMDEVLAAVLEG